MRGLAGALAWRVSRLDLHLAHTRYQSIGGASMARDSQESHAALAEIRDSLLETYASNDAMNQVILTELDPRAWRAQPPGKKGSGRTIASIFAHLHNCRLVWLKNSAPHLKCPRPLDPGSCTLKQAAAAHRKSGGQCLRMLKDALSAMPDRRVAKFSRGS